MKPIRILQVVAHMSPSGGGAETWLMQVLRRIRRERFQMDFLVHTQENLPYHAEVTALGSRLLRCIRPLYFWRYPRVFARLLRENGPYDIVHCHTLFSGFVLRIARRCGVPVRLVHSHTDRGGFQANRNLLQWAFLAWTNRWVRTDATGGVAVSRNAARALFGPDWEADNRWRVLYCGIDLGPFKEHVDRHQVRAELGLPSDAIVLGHVGRFSAEKNHEFLIRIAAAAVRHRPDLRLLLVGDGPLRPVITTMVKRQGLASHVIFSGIRTDIPRLLRGAIDVLLLPSLYEGLPLTVVEAQAAGKPCLVSERVSAEADIVPGLVQRRALSDPPERWAEAALILATNAKREQQESLARVERSPFNISVGLEQLEACYEQAVVNREGRQAAMANAERPFRKSWSDSGENERGPGACEL